jgi:hypothetical protein
MRVFATTIAYLVSLALVAVAAFFIVIVLAGPHSDVLPSWLGAFVVGLGWLTVLLLPALIAYWVWRRLAVGAA